MTDNIIAQNAYNKLIVLQYVYFNNSNRSVWSRHGRWGANRRLSEYWSWNDTTWKYSKTLDVDHYYQIKIYLAGNYDK